MSWRIEVIADLPEFHQLETVCFSTHIHSSALLCQQKSILQHKCLHGDRIWYMIPPDRTTLYEAHIVISQHSSSRTFTVRTIKASINIAFDPSWIRTLISTQVVAIRRKEPRQTRGSYHSTYTPYDVHHPLELHTITVQTNITCVTSRRLHLPFRLPYGNHPGTSLSSRPGQILKFTHARKRTPAQITY